MATQERASREGLTTSATHVHLEAHKILEKLKM